MNPLVAGTRAYHRSQHASAWQQKVQQLRDIQTARGNVKEKLKKKKEIILNNVSLVFKSKNVGSRALYMVSEFLIETKIPMSQVDIQKAKKIETSVGEVHQARHIFQKWNISQDPNKEPIDVVHHYLAVVKENQLADLYPARGSGQVRRNISMYSVSDLKNLCRLRYLKVSGNKKVLVDRLAGEKW